MNSKTLSIGLHEEKAEDRIATISRPISLSSDQYRVLFAKIDLHCRSEGKKVIAITSSIKGEGKTTTASNLAVVCARDFGKQCLLIDGDVRNPSLASQFGLTESAGLIDVLEKRSLLENTMRRGPVENLTLLTMGGAGARDRKVWTTDVIREVLRQARGWFEYVFIDAPPVMSHADINLIVELADGILMVVRSGLAEEGHLAHAVKSIGRSKIIGSVLNGAKSEWPLRREHEYGYY